MKRIFAASIFLFALMVFLTGCMAEVVEVTVVLKNDTDFELRWVVFDIPQSSGTYSPMREIISAEDDSLKPQEERKVTISFVESDFGNSGGALIGLSEDGSSDFLEDAQGELVLERGTNRFTITHDGEHFIIARDDTENDIHKEASNTMKNEEGF